MGGVVADVTDPNNYEIKALRGDGSFASSEAVRYLKEADLVVTNPPFSIWLDYYDVLKKYQKNFVILGNNFSFDKRCFPDFQKGFLFCSPDNKVINFELPNGKQKAVLVKWYWNLPPRGFTKCDNYECWNVDKVKDIPRHFRGFLAVPVTALEFLNKHSQYTICGSSQKGLAPKDFGYQLYHHPQTTYNCLVNGKVKFRRLFIKCN